MSNHVIIKGKNDRLVIALNPDVDFLDICDILKTKILEAKNFIGNSRMAIEFSGRALTNEEENKLIGIITENSNIVISYIFSKRTDSEEEMDLENINPLIEEGKTHFFRGTLRSGSKIESDGNVVVLGDVNPSSIIKARGNVIVLGHLNGTVYAGLGGDDRAFIGAIYFNPLIEEGKTHFFRGTLRSGSKIESDGNVVVLGDVNPSSIIKARGNVIVLGHLNGTVYAGLGGDDRAFIGAIYFNPIQLTIGMKTITDIQDEILDSSRVNKKSRFKVARIRNQEIVVEELI